MDVAPAASGVSARLIGRDDEREALRAAFAEVADERGWTPGGDLGGGSDASILVGAFLDGRLAGGVELRLPDGNGRLPIFGTWPELADAMLGSPAELVLLALLPGFRATPGLLWTLCAEAWRHCARSGITDLLAAVPPRNLRLYARLGWCPEPAGPERGHWGEPCLPCRIGVAAVAEAVAAKVRAAPSLAFVLERAYRD